MKIVAVICGLLLLAAVAYGSYMLKRKINYSLSYESMVEEQVNRIIDKRIVESCLIGESKNEK